MSEVHNINVRSGSGSNDGCRDGQQGKTQAKRDYRKGIKKRKCTLEMKREMLEMIKSGASTCEIMRRFNCPETTIRFLKKNKEALTASVNVFSRFSNNRMFSDTSQQNLLLVITEQHLHRLKICKKSLVNISSNRQLKKFWRRIKNKKNSPYYSEPAQLQPVINALANITLRDDDGTTDDDIEVLGDLWKSCLKILRDLMLRLEEDQMISGTSKFSQLSVQQNFTSSKILDNQWQTAQHCPDAIMAVTRGQDLQQSHTSVTANIRGQEKAQQLTSVKPDSHSQDTQQLLAPLTADRERQDTDIIEDYQRNDIQQCPIPVTKDFQRLHKKQCSSPTLTHDQKMDTVLGFTPKTRNDQREVIQQSLTSDIQGQQMRGTLQPRQMFSSSLSRLKLKLPKFGEKKKMSQSLTETSNKEGSWILSNVIESSSFHHPNVSETRPSNLTSSLFSYTSSSSDKPPNLTTMSNFNSHKSTDHGCLSISTPGGRQTESISGNISQKYHIKVDVAGVGKRCSKELISLTSESENKLPISSCTPHSTLQPKDSVSETHHGGSAVSGVRPMSSGHGRTRRPTTLVGHHPLKFLILVY
ncbi:putative CENP-B N-terminal DNA-binding domain-containing protein 18 [Homarus americanus]|uniref:Putative CENP-B N-terminal DNA-binding domain-containing protein 18 n=1 Tax=Homarus americanus TaxID=6706 RepID=A0A8J5N187_HOMAM|nr:putative CENP-B N-terminal DNA-binding domain-containing protein 18 [Homarus americanus]